MLAHAQDGGPGITKAVEFLPSDPNAPRCNAPPGLTSTFAFKQENDREFLQGVDHGLSLAAKKSRVGLSTRDGKQ